MLNKLKLFLYNHRTWIYTLQYIFVSVLLIALVTFIDNSSFSVRGLVPDFMFTSVELAQTILSTMGGGILTIAIYSFSSILTILTFYSSNFSPQVIENFVGEKITMSLCTADRLS